MAPWKPALAIVAVLGLGLPAGAHALAPVGPGVVGLWQGEGDATDPFNGHNGTLLGGAGFAPSSSGQAFSFTGSQQAVDIPDSASLTPTGSFTIAGWVRTSDTTETQTLLAHYECGINCPGGLANSALALFVDKGKAEGWIRDADAGAPSEEGGQYVTGSTTIADGADHHLAFQRDSAAGTLRLYVDGVLSKSAAPGDVASGPLANQDGEADDFYLGSFRRCSAGAPGCDGTLVDQLSGRLDDAVYWNRVVSAGEIAAIHAAGPNGLTTDSTAPASGASAPASATVGAIQVAFTASDTEGPPPRVHDPAGLSGVDLFVQGPGQPGFTKVADGPGSGEGTFAFTAADVGTYAFATVATDAAGNVESMPAGPDATTVVSAAPADPPSPTPPATPPPSTPKAAPRVTDFVTAVFVPPYLYLRLKCPARFKPGCVGTAIAVTEKGRAGRPMTGAVSANQKPNKWKVAKLTVKGPFTARVEEFSRRPGEKLLSVRQTIHSKGFAGGRPQTVFHVYRVRALTSG